jgi:uncharacterized protein (TIGR02271 family)
MATIQKDRILQFRGQDLYDRDGDKIGGIEEIYLDAETNEPEWALVHTGLFGTKRTFVPLRDATERDGNLAVPFEKSTVKDAPGIEANGQLSQREESELYKHYGLEYSELRSDSGLPEGGAGTTDRDVSDTDRDRDFDAAGTVGHDTSGPTTDNAMTRSEEELRVGTTERESGRVRLRKYIVTDEVQRTVPVKREEVRLEREPITDANVDQALDGPAISEEEHEVVLHEERAVVDKKAVPKERVRLDKDTVTEQETITEDVRKERIDLDAVTEARTDRR